MGSRLCGETDPHCKLRRYGNSHPLLTLLTFIYLPYARPTRLDNSAACTTLTRTWRVISRPLNSNSCKVLRVVCCAGAQLANRSAGSAASRRAGLRASSLGRHACACWSRCTDCHVQTSTLQTQMEATSHSAPKVPDLPYSLRSTSLFVASLLQARANDPPLPVRM